MADRTVEQTRGGDGDTDGVLADVDTDPGVVGDSSTEADDSEGGSYVSLRALLVAFVAVGAGMTLGSLVPVIPFTALAGIPVGSFLHGLFDSERRYVETAVAGGVLAGLAVVSSLLPQLLAGLDGTAVFATAGGVGAVLAVAGHYFGRDLRRGLTRDL